MLSSRSASSFSERRRKFFFLTQMKMCSFILLAVWCKSLLIFSSFFVFRLRTSYFCVPWTVNLWTSLFKFFLWWLWHFSPEIYLDCIRGVFIVTMNLQWPSYLSRLIYFISNTRNLIYSTGIFHRLKRYVLMKLISHITKC